MAGYLEDLDELVLKCRNKNAREYIRESVASYRAEAYRSAIVSCWVAVCYDMIEKLRELALAGDKQASEKIEDLEAIHRSGDTTRSLKFEREILAFARDKVELISALEYEDLDRILKDRHRCAHPSLNAEGEQYAPPAELARLHIHSAVTHLLQHEPAQGKFALDRMLTQIRSKYFPSSQADVLKVFKNSPIRRARPSLVRNLISVLLKDLFLEEEKDYTTSSKLTSSLSAIYTMHRTIYEQRCGEILSGIVSRVGDESLYHVVMNISRFPCAWESLDHTQQGRTSRYVTELPTKYFNVIDDSLSFPPLKKAAMRRLKHASIEDLDEVFPFFGVPKEIIDRAIEIYHNANSFDEANRISPIIVSFLSDFSDEQVRRLISKMASNRQIMESFQLPDMLAKIREAAYKKSLDIDEILREYNLAEFSESTSDKGNEIPF